ncbi:LacI family DNA-binding transcriptional regulator [Bacillus sp. SD088]|uniref:LacI family DNA-binding transcriptional regulator n=1 Tax=Bacillus sp. SD088 TaxID=2782012 RepID=UPI001A962377|nr:LacI family DNA-binding transcriptional regulator [Bacillus sp. SD088]MBO0995768.1 LacI family DNA-binding transcriptional regulator [Bacillus sp. SD088]
MKESKFSVPKYQMVRDYILSMIQNKELSAHARIPSEKDFIEKLGVSSITVRRALAELVDEGIIYRVKGKGSFISEQKQKDQTRSKLITFVLSGKDMYDNSYMRIMKGIQSYLSKHGYKLIIEFIENDIDREKDLVKKLIQTDCEGLLIYSSDPEAAKEYLTDIQSKRIPIVLLDRFPMGIPLPCIACNNYDGGFEAVNHLIDLGHSKIGFCAYDFFLNSEKERYLGYQHALLNANLPSDPTIFFSQSKLDYNELVTTIKKGNLTALFCVNDRMALEVMEQLIKMGIKIPEDLSIIGFDDFESSRYAKVPLTTVQQHFDTLGYEAAKLLLEIRKKAQIEPKKVLLPTNLVIRDSTAAPS